MRYALNTWILPLSVPYLIGYFSRLLFPFGTPGLPQRERASMQHCQNRYYDFIIMRRGEAERHCPLYEFFKKLS